MIVKFRPSNSNLRRDNNECTPGGALLIITTSFPFKQQSPPVNQLPVGLQNNNKKLILISISNNNSQLDCGFCTHYHEMLFHYVQEMVGQNIRIKYQKKSFLFLKG